MDLLSQKNLNAHNARIINPGNGLRAKWVFSEGNGPNVRNLIRGAEARTASVRNAIWETTPWGRAVRYDRTLPSATPSAVDTGLFIDTSKSFSVSCEFAFASINSTAAGETNKFQMILSCINPATGGERPFAFWITDAWAPGGANRLSSLHGDLVWSPPHYDTPTLEVRRKYRIDYTFDESTQERRVYLDGALSAVISGRDRSFSGVFELALGIDNDTSSTYGSGHFDGWIFDVEVYDRAISQSEVSALYVDKYKNIHDPIQQLISPPQIQSQAQDVNQYIGDTSVIQISEQSSTYTVGHNYTGASDVIGIETNNGTYRLGMQYQGSTDVINIVEVEGGNLISEAVSIDSFLGLASLEILEFSIASTIDSINDYTVSVDIPSLLGEIVESFQVQSLLGEIVHESSIVSLVSENITELQIDSLIAESINSTDLDSEIGLLAESESTLTVLSLLGEIEEVFIADSLLGEIRQDITIDSLVGIEEESFLLESEVLTLSSLEIEVNIPSLLLEEFSELNIVSLVGEDVYEFTINSLISEDIIETESPSLLGLLTDTSEQFDVVSLISENITELSIASAVDRLDSAEMQVQTLSLVREEYEEIVSVSLLGEEYEEVSIDSLLEISGETETSIEVASSLELIDESYTDFTIQSLIGEGYEEFSIESMLLISEDFVEVASLIDFVDEAITNTEITSLIDVMNPLEETVGIPSLVGEIFTATSFTSLLGVSEFSLEIQSSISFVSESLTSIDLSSLLLENFSELNVVSLIGEDIIELDVVSLIGESVTELSVDSLLEISSETITAIEAGSLIDLIDQLIESVTINSLIAESITEVSVGSFIVEVLDRTNEFTISSLISEDITEIVIPSTISQANEILTEVSMPSLMNESLTETSIGSFMVGISESITEVIVDSLINEIVSTTEVNSLLSHVSNLLHETSVNSLLAQVSEIFTEFSINSLIDGAGTITSKDMDILSITHNLKKVSVLPTEGKIDVFMTERPVLDTLHKFISVIRVEGDQDIPNIGDDLIRSFGDITYDNYDNIPLSFTHEVVAGGHLVGVVPNSPLLTNSNFALVISEKLHPEYYSIDKSVSMGGSNASVITSDDGLGETANYSIVVTAQSELTRLEHFVTVDVIREDVLMQSSLRINIKTEQIVLNDTTSVVLENSAPFLESERFDISLVAFTRTGSTLVEEFTTSISSSIQDLPEEVSKRVGESDVLNFYETMGFSKRVPDATPQVGKTFEIERIGLTAVLITLPREVNILSITPDIFSFTSSEAFGNYLLGQLGLYDASAEYLINVSARGGDKILLELERKTEPNDIKYEVVIL